MNNDDIVFPDQLRISEQDIGDQLPFHMSFQKQSSIYCCWVQFSCIYLNMSFVSNCLLLYRNSIYVVNYRFADYFISKILSESIFSSYL
jgi:hypothetical protein